jgi:hypothetical protein
VVIGEAQHRARQQLTRRDGEQPGGQQAGEGAKEPAADEVHRDHRERADDRRCEGAHELDGPLRGRAEPHDERDGTDGEVEEQRHRHLRRAGAEIRVDGGALREVARQVVDQPHVVPRVAVLVIHAGVRDDGAPEEHRARQEGHEHDEREQAPVAEGQDALTHARGAPPAPRRPSPHAT